VGWKDPNAVSRKRSSGRRPTTLVIFRLISEAAVLEAAERLPCKFVRPDRRCRRHEVKCRKPRRWAATAEAIHTPAGHAFSLVDARRPACSCACSRSAQALRFLAAAPINRQAPMQRPGALRQPEPPARMAGRRRREPRARAAHAMEVQEWAVPQPAVAVHPRRQDVETRRARPPRAARAATAGQVVPALACLEQLAGPTSRRCLAGQALAIDIRLDASLPGAPVLRMDRSPTTDIYRW
jgi:hypothetical protein